MIPSAAPAVLHRRSSDDGVRVGRPIWLVSMMRLRVAPASIVRKATCPGDMRLFPVRKISIHKAKGMKPRILTRISFKVPSSQYMSRQNRTTISLLRALNFEGMVRWFVLPIWLCTEAPVRSAKVYKIIGSGSIAAGLSTDLSAHNS